MASTVVTNQSVLTVDGVTKSFSSGPPWHRRRVEVLRGASLEVRPGELVGLVGENGSGKSTLMQVIVGLLSRDAGTLSAPARLGYCPQQPLLWDKLTVDEHFELFARAYALDDQTASAIVVSPVRFRPSPFPAAAHRPAASSLGHGAGCVLAFG